MTLSDIAPLVWRANLSLAASLALLIAARGLIRRLAGSDVVYLLWLIVPVGLVVAVTPLPYFLEQTAWLQPPAILRDRLDIWLAGMGVAFALVLIGYFRLLRAARRGRIGPAIIGLVSPRLYLPADFKQRFEPDEQAVIRAHERTHLLRWDAQANAAVALLQIAFWCNPLVYLAARLFREDQEMACDETVMDLYPERRRLYAQTMLKSQTIHWSPSLGCAFARHPLVDRISALNLKPSIYSRISLNIGLVGLIFAAWITAIIVYSPLKEPSQDSAAVAMAER